jgi:hypothetical protein
MPKAETKIGKPMGMNGANATATTAPKIAARRPCFVCK